MSPHSAHLPSTSHHTEPTVYVYHFAKHLNFSSKQTKVLKDVLRIIHRMSRDWMVQGGRSSDICGAALILAVHMNNFRRSVREVIYVVKVADLTIQKWLDEFKDIKSGGLIVEELGNIWSEQAHDPPSYGPKAANRPKRVRGVNDDGEIIKDPQNTTIIATPRDLSAAPSTPILPTPLDKPLRLNADGLIIPELPVPSPLPSSSLPGTPIDVTDPPHTARRRKGSK